MQPYQIGPESHNWRTSLLACTGGRPVDPDVFPEPFKEQQQNSRSSQKTTRRESRSLLPREHQHVISSRSRKASYRQHLEGLENHIYRIPEGLTSTTSSPYYNRAGEPLPFSHRVRKAVSTSSHSQSPSKSQTTRATATTNSSSSHNSHTAHESPPLRNISSSRLRQALEKEHKLAQTATTNQSFSTPSLTITASTSFSDDVSFLSFQYYDDDDEAAEDSKRLEEENQQLQFGRRRASDCFDRYGIQHRHTATAFLELGLVHVRCEQYAAAKDFFRTALRVFEKQFGPKDLRVAKTLEALGMAQSQVNSWSPSSPSSASASSASKPNKAGLLLGLQSFRKCFRIRYDVLGPTHIDTVETLNKIANIYMKLQMYSSARNDYFEVLTLRSAILGDQHPSVAVAAQSLGMAHLQQQQNEQAKAYFLQALNVFAMTGLGDHPMAEQLRQDIKLLGFDLKRMEI